MSTYIGTIKGRFEAKEDPKTFSVTYGDAELHLNRFSGGKKKGAMLSMTIDRADGEYVHIQLTKEQVKEMILQLKEAFKIGSWKL